MDISKLDAAKRQLDTAINLYFKDADPVSIHTLTAAAHQILMDLAKIEGIKSFMKDTSIIRKGKEKEFLAMINEAENFFKHAEKDPHGLLKFIPAQTETFLLDAVEMYMQLTKEMPDDMSIYRVWFLLKNPEIVSDETKKELQNKNINYVQYAKTTSKSAFYKTMKDGLFRL